MIELPLSQLVDFTNLSAYDNVQIEIVNNTYSFSPDAAESGVNVKYAPIFGSNVYISGVLFASNQFGLPTLLFPQGSAPLINFVNNTKFTTNLHFHGVINTGLTDGGTSFAAFGPSTSLGTSVDIQLPIIRNNSALLWYHSHSKFRDVELVYSGLFGSIIITDKISKPLNDMFIYGDNYLVLNCLDIDLDSNGCQTFSNLTVKLNRSCFTSINGVSTIQWYTDPLTSVPYSNILSHNTNENIVKIDIANTNSNWRVFYLGVCDSNQNILPFYVIQTDQGLCAPVQTTIQFIPVGGRISILLDLTSITNAYLFCYDYELTEFVDIISATEGVFPNFTQSSSTPYPSPIPDPTDTNQQSNPTKLNYPDISLIPQLPQQTVYGRLPVPSTSTIRPFLYVTNTSGNNNLSMEYILTTINNIIYKNGIPPTNNINYFSSLNPNYYYNLPTVTSQTPFRNICLWKESDINYIYGSPKNAYITNGTSNVYGVTELCDGSKRARVDLWNSAELDLNQALVAYSNSPNNYKPNVLPSSEFRVTKTNDNFINIAMISNDTYTIQGFNNNIQYGDTTTIPTFSVTIILPPTEPLVNLNIDQWINLLNNSLINTNINLNGKTIPASRILYFDWSFFPYGVNLINGTTQYFKSAVIKTKNSSNYCIRILARWALLQMMGKTLTGNANLTPPIPNSGPCCSVDAPCDEEYLYGVYDNYIQTWYPYYATANINVANPILCPRRNGQLIIQSNQTYIGLYDGFYNDNLKVFSTKLLSTEIWTYLNGGAADSHPLHFHLTSGFSYQSLSTINSTPGTPGTDTTPGLTHTYSRDTYQIGSQQSLSFAITWPYYSSEETTNSPYIPNVGSVVHCHFLPHYDQNSMAFTYAVNPLSNLISDICFPAGTPVTTDQCIIPIETILPGFHTIGKKNIIGITKTISLDSYLICFEKNSLGENIPSKKTILSKKHKLVYKNKMFDAEWFIGKFENVYKVKYDGEILYNVLMENYDKMIVNNLLCETLHPENHIAKLYKLFKKIDHSDYNKLIKTYNCYSITSSKNNSKKLKLNFT